MQISSTKITPANLKPNQKPMKEESISDRLVSPGDSFQEGRYTYSRPSVADVFGEGLFSAIPGLGLLVPIARGESRAHALHPEKMDRDINVTLTGMAANVAGLGALVAGGAYGSPTGIGIGLGLLAVSGVAGGFVANQTYYKASPICYV